MCVRRWRRRVWSLGRLPYFASRVVVVVVVVDGRAITHTLTQTPSRWNDIAVCECVLSAAAAAAATKTRPAESRRTAARDSAGQRSSWWCCDVCARVRADAARLCVRERERRAREARRDGRPARAMPKLYRGTDRAWSVCEVFSWSFAWLLFGRHVIGIGTSSAARTVRAPRAVRRDRRALVSPFGEKRRVRYAATVRCFGILFCFCCYCYCYSVPYYFVVTVFCVVGTQQCYRIVFNAVIILEPSAYNTIISLPVALSSFRRYRGLESKNVRDEKNL